MNRYVAELHLPAPVYMPVKERQKLGTPEYYGCRRGYWSIYSKPDRRGTLEPLGLRLIVELLDSLDLPREEFERAGGNDRRRCRPSTDDRP